MLSLSFTGMMGHPGMGHQRPPFQGYQQMGGMVGMPPRPMGPAHMQVSHSIDTATVFWY